MAEENHSLRTTGMNRLAAGEGNNADWQGLANFLRPLLRNRARESGYSVEDTEDLVQQLLLKIHTMAIQKRLDLGEGNWRGYLYTCAMNQLRDFYRKSQRDELFRGKGGTEWQVVVGNQAAPEETLDEWLVASDVVERLPVLLESKDEEALDWFRVFLLVSFNNPDTTAGLLGDVLRHAGEFARRDAGCTAAEKVVSADYWKAFLLSHVVGFKNKDVARLLGKEEAAVRQAASRVNAQIRKRKHDEP